MNKEKIKMNKKNIIIISILLVAAIIGLILALSKGNTPSTRPKKVHLTEYQNENTSFKYSDIWKLKESTENKDGSGQIRFRLKEDEQKGGDIFIQYGENFSDYYANNKEFYESMNAKYLEKTLDNGEIVHSFRLIDDDIIFGYDYKSTKNGDIVVVSQFKKENDGHVEQIIETFSILNKIIEEEKQTTENITEESTESINEETTQSSLK